VCFSGNFSPSALVSILASYVRRICLSLFPGFVASTVGRLLLSETIELLTEQ